MFAIDDSGSMYQESRIPQLKRQLTTTLEVDFLFDKYSDTTLTNGVRVEYLNRKEGVTINDASKVKEEVDKISFNGATRLGTQLNRKILEPIFTKKRNNEMKKPALVYIITDGEVRFEHHTLVTVFYFPIPKLTKSSRP
jgi:hypothetical protein